MTTVKNLSAALPRKGFAGGDPSADLLSDVIDPSPRYSAYAATEPATLANTEYSRTALSELRAPKISRRVGFNEFLD